MYIITKIALKERIRKKELLIVLLIGCLILLLIGGDSSTLSIEGEPVTGYKNMLPVLHIIVNTIVCILAVTMSLSTIPNEYQRKTSHLVWVRKVSQTAYHGGLLLANVFTVMIAAFFLYLFIAVYMCAHGNGQYIYRLLAAYPLECVNVILISSLTTVLSIKLPVYVNALISSLVTFIGILSGVLDLYKNIVGGITKKAISFVLIAFPDLHRIQKSAASVILGNEIETHAIWKGLFLLWILVLGLVCLKKKEA